MENGWNDKIRNQYAGQRKLGGALRPRRAVLLLIAGLLLPAIPAWAGEPESPELSLPDAPQPQSSTPAAAPAAVPCPAGNVAKPAPPAAVTAPAGASAQPGAQPAPCPPHPEKNWFERFLTGPEVKPMTPSEKFWLAARDVEDPFNAITILGSSAIAVGANAHSAYGPGMAGFGRYVGVSYSQDITLEFFTTFLIPTIVHQDPHYHRMPDASVPRRIGHAITQVVWTLGDNGKGMVNYANIVGFAIEDEIGDLYVPGQQTNLPASAERYGISLASAPIENFVDEFLPDVARRIHIRVVLFQRIINQVAKTSGP
ncbi:MAG TPA: hypothetical protein VKF63_05720 [Terracidiphilus sp.]|nr:hypothetical protein [Terracidiphilus sp.]